MRRFPAPVKIIGGAAIVLALAVYAVQAGWSGVQAVACWLGWCWP